MGQVWVLGSNQGQVLGPELGSCFKTEVGFQIEVGVRIGFQYWGSRSGFYTSSSLSFGIKVEVRF